MPDQLDVTKEEILLNTRDAVMGLKHGDRVKVDGFLFDVCEINLGSVVQIYLTTITSDLNAYYYALSRDKYTKYQKYIQHLRVRDGSDAAVMTREHLWELIETHRWVVW